MISFPDTSLETLPPPEARDWWVISGVKGAKRSLLFVVCRITGMGGCVMDPTDEEIAAAQGTDDFKYRWSDESRIVLDGEKGGLYE